jgi:branched-subunit amino acid transport protein
VSRIGLILAMGAAVYALRLVGLVLPGAVAPPRGERVLRFLPVALLAALVVGSLGSPPDGLSVRVASVAGGALVAFWTRRMWACIAGGLLIHGLLSSG